MSSQLDLLKVKIINLKRFKNQTRDDILVGFYVYIDEQGITLQKEIPYEENKKSDFYLRKAFRLCKKEIKDWLKTLTEEESLSQLIGTEYILGLEDRAMFLERAE